MVSSLRWFLVFVGLVCVRDLSFPRRADAAGAPGPVREVLDAVGLEPDDLRFDSHDMAGFGGDRWKLPVFDAMVDRPLRIPGDVEIVQLGVHRAAPRTADLFASATSRLATGVRRGLLGDVVAPYRGQLARHDPLAGAIRDLWKRSGDPYPPEIEAMVRTRCARLPDSLAVPLAVFLEAAVAAIDARTAAFAPLAPPHGAWSRRGAPGTLGALERDAIAYVVGSDAGTLPPEFNRSVEEPAGVIDYRLWNAGTMDLLLVLDRILPALERNAALVPPRGWSIETPFGAIRFAGPSRDTHRESPPSLLVFDAGGDDVYEGGAAGSIARPVSIVIDLSGNDRYAARDTLGPAFGAGILGTGVLIDRSGNDDYRAGHVAEGAGLYGIGILIDHAGNDRYDAITAAQGSGLFGVGILSDLSGNDAYHAFQQVQGYGYIRGAGYLVDNAGDDTYVADDTTIRFPSAQSKEHNSSLAQGFGFGKRSDYMDGHSLAGGYGLLADAAGNDTYRCGVFGQGCAYWYGVGILADAAGNDAYDGVWYVQGSGAHFACGVLWEGDGNDRYHATMNMAIGAGHDFSLGLLYDRRGDDTYDAPNLSLGGGNANGIGLFWDVAGADHYRVEAATTLGRANTASRGGLRDRMETLGIFLDTGGTDTYPAAKAFAGNGRTWTQEGTDIEHPLDTERGAGIDTEWDPASEPNWKTRAREQEMTE